jgi:hypothetical protein
MKPETDENSPLEDYELIMDSYFETLNQYDSEWPAKYVRSFDAIVRAVLGIPSEDSLLNLIVPTPASPDPATSGPQAE